MATTYRSRETVRLEPSARVVPTNYTYPTNYAYSTNDQPIKIRQQQTPHVNVVVTQPGRDVWEFEHPWSTKLCSCCANMKLCCFAFFCPCCFEYKLYKRAGENICSCLCPGSRFALRSKIRTAFRIEVIIFIINLKIELISSAEEDSCIAYCLI
ncbi:unnamed protein product [Rotaria sp. Silwood2]|nr:unnamed protein product [Rotaria sp. Silwood2]CAF4496928.1 unnamed protein product [Rotaria sp. Silwood2]